MRRQAAAPPELSVPSTAVFVDVTGRRARVVTVLGRLAASVAVLYIAGLAFSLLGVSWVPQVGLPGVGSVLDSPNVPAPALGPDAVAFEPPAAGGPPVEPAAVAASVTTDGSTAPSMPVSGGVPTGAPGTVVSRSAATTLPPESTPPGTPAATTPATTAVPPTAPAPTAPPAIATTPAVSTPATPPGTATSPAATVLETLPANTPPSSHSTASEPSAPAPSEHGPPSSTPPRP